MSLSECILSEGYLCGNYSGTGDGADLHRKVYEERFGAITPGMDLDHECGHKPCINPFHLTEVTRSENMLRALVERKYIPCSKGHRDKVRAKDGRLFCQTCNRERSAAWRKRSRP